jgi:hypothetical protein
MLPTFWVALFARRVSTVGIPCIAQMSLMRKSRYIQHITVTARPCFYHSNLPTVLICRKTSFDWRKVTITCCYWCSWHTELRKIPLAECTVPWNISGISEYIYQLIDQVKISRYAFQVVELPDITKDAHLISYVLYELEKDCFVEQTIWWLSCVFGSVQYN